MRGEIQRKWGVTRMTVSIIPSRKTCLCQKCRWKEVLRCGIYFDFPGGSDGKASVYKAGDLGSSPGLGRYPGEGNGNPLQYYCLENPMDRGAWYATVYGVTKSQIRLSNFTSHYLLIGLLTLDSVQRIKWHIYNPILFFFLSRNKQSLNFVKVRKWMLRKKKIEAL